MSAAPALLKCLKGEYSMQQSPFSFCRAWKKRAMSLFLALVLVRPLLQTLTLTRDRLF